MKYVKTDKKTAGGEYFLKDIRPSDVSGEERLKGKSYKPLFNYSKTPFVYFACQPEGFAASEGVK